MKALTSKPISIRLKFSQFQLDTKILSGFFFFLPPPQSLRTRAQFWLPGESWCQRWGRCQLRGVPTHPAVIATKPEARCNLSILHHSVLNQLSPLISSCPLAPFFYLAWSKEKTQKNPSARAVSTCTVVSMLKTTRTLHSCHTNNKSNIKSLATI